VRIGSRSKSEEFEDYNLSRLIKMKGRALKSGQESYRERELYGLLNSLHEEGDALCKSLIDGSNLTWKQAASFLMRHYPSHYEQLSTTIDEDGFEMVGQRNESLFDHWIQGKDLEMRELYAQYCAETPDLFPDHRPRDVRELARAGSDIWTFSREERKGLARYWARDIRQDWLDGLLVKAGEHKTTIEELELLKADWGRRLLETADVVGVTTTGLARNATQLDRICSKTLICEEAGEVLEVAP
jgi:hypothetical protein